MHVQIVLSNRGHTKVSKTVASNEHHSVYDRYRVLLTSDQMKWEEKGCEAHFCTH